VTGSLLGGLAALGLADHGPAGYALPADGATLTGWLRDAGLTGVALRRGAGPIALLRGTAPDPGP